MRKNNIAVFTNLEALAFEIVHGAGAEYTEVVDFIQKIDEEVADSEFTDQLKAMVAKL